MHDPVTCSLHFVQYWLAHNATTRRGRRCPGRDQAKQVGNNGRRVYGFMGGFFPAPERRFATFAMTMTCCHCDSYERLQEPRPLRPTDCTLSILRFPTFFAPRPLDQSASPCLRTSHLAPRTSRHAPQPTMFNSRSLSLFLLSLSLGSSLFFIYPVHAKAGAEADLSIRAHESKTPQELCQGTLAR